MTPIQTSPPVDPPADDPAGPAEPAVWPDRFDLRVGGDMTVEVAMSVMAGARAGHLLLCDEDDQFTGLVTRARLAAVRDSSSYTDRVRLRDVIVTGESVDLASIMPPVPERVLRRPQTSPASIAVESVAVESFADESFAPPVAAV